MAYVKDSTPTPAPVIGKIGPYTVFLTPPPSSPKSPTGAGADPIPDIPKKVVSRQHSIPPPPVRPPPAQFSKPSSNDLDSGFFRNAISKIQNAHSSLDEFVAKWLGLNQSKYQWALDDYYEAKELGDGDAKTKEVSSNGQCV